MSYLKIKALFEKTAHFAQNLFEKTALSAQKLLEKTAHFC